MCFNDKYTLKNFKRTIPFFLLVFLFIAPIQCPVLAQSEFISIDEIHPGMKGFGKTVFSGTEIEEFDVEVIEIITGADLSYPYILVQLSGNRIDSNGGISAGMSGSPVYLEGKLAGAISHSWEMSEHNLCLITPIEKMIALFDYVNKQEIPEQKFSYLLNHDTVTVILNDNLEKRMTGSIPDFEENLNSYVSEHTSAIDFHSIQSPLLIKGFEGRANELLKKNLQKKGVPFVRNIPNIGDFKGEFDIETENNELKPGAAIGVQFATGDASVLTIGTATYCRDNLVLAFGHPLMHYGNVSYLFSAVYIFHSFPSIVMPFKIGTPYRLLGEVMQDREAGVLARLNHFPAIVSCKITVSDLDRDRKMYSGAKIVPQNDIVQSVVDALLVQSVDRAIDRIGQGTATVHLGLRSARNGQRITRENVFFSKDDIAVQCGKDLDELFDLMFNNYSKNMQLGEIEINIAVEEQNHGAMIKEVRLDKKGYLSGDTIEAKITLKPFRQPEVEKVARISIPEDMTTGEAILMIKGGASPEIFVDETSEQNKEQYLLEGWEEIQDYSRKKIKNNQISVEVISTNVQERLPSNEEEDNQKDETELKVVLDTDFIVEGYHEMYLNIKNDENRSKE